MLEAVFVVLLVFGGLLFRNLNKKLMDLSQQLTQHTQLMDNRSEPNFSVNVDTQPISIELNRHTSDIKSELNALPDDILRALTGSANTHKGKLGELVGYISLKAEYDKIIPLGSIVDFVCLKFPTSEVEGSIDFIDIKTGDNARLNKDQRMLRKIIVDKKIKFKTIKVDSIDGLENESDSTDKTP